MRQALRNLLSVLSLLSCLFLLPNVSRAAASPSISITPGAATVEGGESLQFKAKVVGLSNTEVKWEVGSVSGGNSSDGTISSEGLYKAPSKFGETITKFIVTAVASDGKTKGNVTIDVKPAGPAISSITPDPIAPGKYSITLHGAGYKPGAVVRNGAINLATRFVNSTELVAAGEQASVKPGVFQVTNPDSLWGATLTVPFAAHGAAPVISPKSIYVHLGKTQHFTATNTTYWTASEGVVDQTGYYIAPANKPASGVVTITATGPGGSATAEVTLAEGAEPTITPKTATLGLGEKLQFVSSGSKTWSAVFGSITEAGLYTAPAVWPLGSADEITVNGINGSDVVKITISPAVPVITAVGGDGRFPLGPYSTGIAGKNFSPASTAYLCGEEVNVVYSGGTLKVKGFCGTVGAASLIVKNGPLTSAAFPIEVGLANPKVSPAAARRFLEQAAFGPSPSEAERVQALGFAAWLDDQYKRPPTSGYQKIGDKDWSGMPMQFLSDAVDQPDQLRQRVAFALSQIFVTSLIELGANSNMDGYQDMLLGDALGNYQKIMLDVTLSPAMGSYLNVANNAKANPTEGSLANENFAREMMQLFTLGTAMLNPDGSVQLDATGQPIPTYTQFQVTEFARVYTGWTYAPPKGKAVQWGEGNVAYTPMVPYPDEHDTGSKQLLNGYVSPAGVTPETDIENAIANIFSHPNIGPFVCRQLIQHLVKSNPTPAYVARVAATFANDGSGVRGDMKAVVSAILLDPEARANDAGGNDQVTDGHLQEPALFVAGMVRAFGGEIAPQNDFPWYLGNLSQNIFSAPSVFNYYAPTYAVPGTSSNGAELVGGEFQIDSPNNAVLRANLVSDVFGSWSDPVATFGPGTAVDLTPYVNLGGSPATLVNALDLTLTHGTMPAAMKSAIVTAVAGETGGNLRRVQRGIYLILTSSYYNVWH